MQGGLPATQDPRYDMGLRTELKRILDAEDEPVRPYLDLGTAREVADEVVDRVAPLASTPYRERPADEPVAP